MTLKTLLSRLAVVAMGIGIFMTTAAPSGPDWQVMLIGRVTDACTGHPVGEATVSVAPVDRSHPPNPIRTNGGGHFLVKLPTRSSVLVTVMADGYLPVGGTTSSNGDSQFISPAILVTWPPGPPVRDIRVALSPIHPPNPCMPPGPPN